MHRANEDETGAEMAKNTGICAYYIDCRPLTDAQIVQDDEGDGCLRFPLVSIRKVTACDGVVPVAR